MAENGRARCAATTKAGKPCQNYPPAGQRYCRWHLPVGDGRGLDTAPTIPVETEPATDGRSPWRLDFRLAGRRLQLDLGDPEIQEQWGQLQEELHQLRSNLRRLFPRLPPPVQERLQGLFSEDLLDVETWKGLWFMVDYNVRYQADMVRRRFTGEYETDEWGLDWEFVDTVQPFFNFMYRGFFRARATGLEHVPDSGGALLAVNHSTQWAWDGIMLMTGLQLDHPAQRLLRLLYAGQAGRLPFLSLFLEKGGQAPAGVENGARLLEQGELVGLFPEGWRGVGKLFPDSYRLARFRQVSLARMALVTGAPIIPVTIVNGAEIQALLRQSRLIARLLDAPSLWPAPGRGWLAPLGLLPLPGRWTIEFGPPIDSTAYPPDAAEDPAQSAWLTDEVRQVMRRMLLRHRAGRPATPSA